MLNTMVTHIVRRTRSLAKIYGSNSGKIAGGERTQREVCEMLEAYYINNDLWANVQQALAIAGQWSPSVKPLRNPTAAVVEFYASTVWPGPLPEALPIVAEGPVAEAVQDIWRRSNWEERKQLAIRQAAITGDVFLRVAKNANNRPFIQVVLTKNVSDWKEDDAGNIVWLRYDVSQRAKPGDADARTQYHTEIWEPGRVRTWKHRVGYNATEAQMGEAVEVDTGLDFVPWVRACFRDVGEPFGVPPIWTALDKLDEINIKATRFSQLLFRHNQNTWALSANGVDAAGRPLPPPTLTQGGVKRDDPDTVTFRDNEIVRLPGNASLTSLVPNINWQAHADAIMADYDEIARDLPEIRYYELMQTSQASGVALAYMMAPAIQRALEVRGNMERALVKVNMMAITVGQRAGLYRDAGTYEDGATNHRFRERDVLPPARRERAETAAIYVNMGVPVETALGMFDHWTPEEITKLQAAITDAAIRTAGVTAGPQAPVTVQSATRVAARDAATPALEQQLSGALTGAVERALDAMNAQLAEFIGARGGR